jgi:hypothetical protein
MTTEEEKRLKSTRDGVANWRKWGPYVSDRQWGTVREDYSVNGDAWTSVSYEDSRFRAYRWGEDGIAGISDEEQRLCFALCLWNGKDPILKERLFGLTGHQGNHGEDVKEYSFFLDNLPSHAYMKYLYKYPQKEYPYSDLIQENQRRTRFDFEYELLDTGIFAEDRYFDVTVEYAKNDIDDILIRISMTNRGPELASLYVLPTLWFRNTWSWAPEHPKPLLKLSQEGTVEATHPFFDAYTLFADPPKEWLFTENETNKERLFGIPNDTPYVKDGIHEYIIHGRQNAVNPEGRGTKVVASYLFHIASGQTQEIHLRLSKDSSLKDPLGKKFAQIFSLRKKEADAFYKQMSGPELSEDMSRVQRQAFAGMLWNKQFYHYNVSRWLQGDPLQVKPPSERHQGRNSKWKWFDAADIFSMPDKWEYPWFAAWDLAFHAVTFAAIDPDFAKAQLLLLTKEWYMFPNGQMPAYEWDFGDVNPPVHAWAALQVYQMEKEMYGRQDREFLEKMFQKLVLNFTWWVNREDKGDRNIFEGGFLGLDNICGFDRTKGAPNGGMLYQVDATSWMGMYCLNLLQIALELSKENAVYEDMATKFFDHFIAIADVINSIDGGLGLWDDVDGFYHGVITFPDGRQIRTQTVTMIGVIPLFAVLVENWKDDFPIFQKRFQWLLKHRPHLTQQIVDMQNTDGKVLFSFVSPEKMVRIFEKVFDEAQLLSPYGIRSVSKKMAEEPSVLYFEEGTYTLNYEPAESTTDLFGGNSNWRGPVWFPLNYLLIQSLETYRKYLGETFKIEYPQKSGQLVSLQEVICDLSRRLVQIFLRNENGYRPVYGGMERFQKDPHWNDYLLFHEYFHGDNGAGLGASHQTGWTGLVALLIQQYGQDLLKKKP